MKNKVIYGLVFLGVSLSCFAAQDYIIVNKKNVLHKFVKFDQATDHFTKNVFPYWENETFEVFDSVKNPEGIAIDIGAWIGTTAIWLSKNFHHVISIDADPVSLKCLKMNLEASECSNVTICPRPVAQKTNKMIFGPRGNDFNESTSYIKDVSEGASATDKDYAVRGITLKQLLHDYIFANSALASHPISFIKCDIEGGEENIIEDLLYFAYYNKVKVYLSFHTSWWKSKKITDFEYLFKFFKARCPGSDAVSYIQSQPFGSVLFEPRNDMGTMLKKDMPVVIIGYNQYTYISKMVSQLEKYTSDIIVIDNNSSFKPLLDYYENEFKYTLLKQTTNYGHRVYVQSFVQRLVGDQYILTDPDLEFNSQLPENFISQMIDIAHYFKSGKLGFALLIDAPDIRPDAKLSGLGTTIKDWEIGFWKHKMSYPVNSSLELYRAPIDTTFCLITKQYDQSHGNCIRIAGDFTCKHLPWHINFKEKLLPNEYEAYTQNNISTSWFKYS
jgi:FkbM family methyltransferase